MHAYISKVIKYMSICQQQTCQYEERAEAAWSITIFRQDSFQQSVYSVGSLYIFPFLQSSEHLYIYQVGVCMEDLIYYLYKNQVNLFNVMPSIWAKVDLSNYFNCNYIYVVLPTVFFGQGMVCKIPWKWFGQHINCRQRS